MKVTKHLPERLDTSLDKPQRIFGHNIDLNGKLTYDPQNAGYKVLVAIEDNNIKKSNVKTEIIEAGRFIVTGIEGNIQSEGKWIMEGWGRLNKMITAGPSGCTGSLILQGFKFH